MGLHVWLITSKQTDPALHNQSNMTLGSCVLLARALRELCGTRCKVSGAGSSHLINIRVVDAVLEANGG